MNTYNGIHPDLAAVLNAEKIDESAVSRRYSDAYVNCETHAQAARIRSAGAWRSMATTFTDQTNGKPSVDVPFAYLGAVLSRNERTN